MNVGKVFENDFKASVPDYCLLQRLNDPPQSFSQGAGTRFSIKNPCDFLLFQTRSRILYCLELKSTNKKFMSFENISEENPKKKMIHKHQILGLSHFGSFPNVTAGFLFNFRSDEIGNERTYFQSIQDFMIMYKSLGKWSFNEIDLIMYHGTKLDGEKKRTHYTWNINQMFEKLEGLI